MERLAAADFHAHHDLAALLPFREELAQQLRRLLQVGHERNHRVAAGLEHAVKRRADMAKIAAVDDYLDMLVFRRQSPENRLRLVGGGVVDEDVLVAVSTQRGEYFLDPPVTLFDIIFFVVAGRYNANEFHDQSFLGQATGGSPLGNPASCPWLAG